MKLSDVFPYWIRIEVLATLVMVHFASVNDHLLVYTVCISVVSGIAAAIWVYRIRRYPHLFRARSRIDWHNVLRGPTVSHRHW